MFKRLTEFKKFDEVQKSVKELNKDVLLIFGSKECPPCNELSKVLDKFETDKDLVVVDLKKPFFEDMDICKSKYGLTVFPTLIKVDKDLNKKLMILGYKGEEHFEDFIDENF